MKDLTNDEWEQAPSLIKAIYMWSAYDVPISMTMFDKALEEHPEYFPEEVEYRRKWESIPQEIHDEYGKERQKIEEQRFKEMPEGKGIMHMMDNPEDMEEWDKKYREVETKYKPLKKALHKKYYGEYGIKWKGW